MINRLIPIVLHKNGRSVRTLQFEHHFPIGQISCQMDRLEQWKVDELVILNIENSPSSKSFYCKVLPNAKKNFRRPLAVGGGINSVYDAEIALRNGADKIIIGGTNPQKIELLKNIRDVFGSSSVIYCLDYRVLPNNSYVIYRNSSSILSERKFLDHVKKIMDSGAGEILLQNTLLDGTGQGFDLNTFSLVLDEITIPVIPCGGAGSTSHFSEILKRGAVDIAASNIFLFTENSYINIKSNCL